jgi:hypothetical protein
MLDELDPLDIWQLEEHVRCLDCDSIVTLHPPALVRVVHRDGCPSARSEAVFGSSQGRPRKPAAISLSVTRKITKIDVT